MRDIINKQKSIITEYFREYPNLVLSIGIIVNNDMDYMVLDKDGGVNEVYNYALGSITKLITGSLLAKLVKDGLVKLDEPIDQYLPLEEGLYPTIRELASHTSGYKRMTPFFKTVKSFMLHGYCRKNPYEKIDKEDVLKYIKPKKTKINKYIYSDFNYAILGLIIERVTQLTYPEVIEKYCDELGMHDTKVYMNTSLNLDGYSKNKNYGHWNWETDSGFISAGGIYSNIKDMLTFCRHQLEPSERLRLTQKKMRNILFGRKKVPMGVGIGWHMYPKGNYLWHRGGVGCFRSAIAVHKKRKIAVVILANSVGNRKVNCNILCTRIYNEIKKRSKATK